MHDTSGNCAVRIRKHLTTLRTVIQSPIVKRKRAYGSLQEWMEENSCNGLRLLALIKEQTGHVISQPMLSMILRKSRRCSRVNAFAIHKVTGVDMDVLMAWDDKRLAR